MKQHVVSKCWFVKPVLMKISQLATHFHLLHSSFLTGKGQQEWCRALESEAELQWAASLQGLGWRCSSSDHQAPSICNFNPDLEISCFIKRLPSVSAMDPRNLVPAALGQWKCELFTCRNSKYEISLPWVSAVETLGRWISIDLRKAARPESLGFYSMAIKSWELWLPPKKNPGLIAGSLKTRRVVAGTTVSEVPKIWVS